MKTKIVAEIKDRISDLKDRIKKMSETLSIIKIFLIMIKILKKYFSLHQKLVKENQNQNLKKALQRG